MSIICNYPEGSHVAVAIHSLIHLISQNTSYIKQHAKINVLSVPLYRTRPVALKLPVQMQWATCTAGSLHLLCLKSGDTRDMMKVHKISKWSRLCTFYGTGVFLIRWLGLAILKLQFTKFEVSRWH